MGRRRIRKRIKINKTLVIHKEKQATAEEILPAVLNQRGCSMLVCAIVSSAVKDWRTEYAYLEKGIKELNTLLSRGFSEDSSEVQAKRLYISRCEASVARVEAFMTSDWYQILQTFAPGLVPTNLVAYCRKNPHSPNPTVWEIRREYRRNTEDF